MTKLNSIGIDKDPKNTLLVVAMSGGVDSSTVAGIMKHEGYKVILINSNPATIMTDPDVADKTYIEPITIEVLEKILIKENNLKLSEKSFTKSQLYNADEVFLIVFGLSVTKYVWRRLFLLPTHRCLSVQDLPRSASHNPTFY